MTTNVSVTRPPVRYKTYNIIGKCYFEPSSSEVCSGAQRYSQEGFVSLFTPDEARYYRHFWVSMCLPFQFIHRVPPHSHTKSRTPHDISHYHTPPHSASMHHTGTPRQYNPLHVLAATHPRHKGSPRHTAPH